MKGVVLAGGAGTRLYPLTKIGNKHLLPVGRHPMIHYGVKKLREAGIRDILIITGRNAAGAFIEYLGDGSDWGVRLTYRVQEEAGGIAQALLIAEGFIPEGEKFVVLLGDNLFSDSLSEYLHAFSGQQTGAMVLLKKVDDPERFGVPVLMNGRIVSIKEKPVSPPSRYCVTGIYMYDSNVFDVIRRLAPSGRGELEITDVNNCFASVGTLCHDILGGWWIDAGTFGSLWEASDILMREEGDIAAKEGE